MAAKCFGAVPCHIEDVTPLWLTERLRDCGALASGSVTAVSAKIGAKWNAALTARLTLGYDTQAPAEAPRSLFIKLSKPDDPLAQIFPGEIVFYGEPRPEGLPLARCYGAQLDPSSGSAFVLLEDLSGTHSQTPWPKLPSLAKCEAAVRALARLHAHWWNGSPSAADIRALGGNYAKLAAHVQTLLPAFFDGAKETLPRHRRALLEEVCVKLPTLLTDRISNGGPITRVHGDPHFWNVMFPKDPARHGCVFFDWEDWRPDVPAGDLAYMIALHWDRERRERHERPLLRRYHEALCAEIPGGTTWDELLADYRLGHLQNFAVPVFQFHMGVTSRVRRPQLERLFQAFEDLDCGALL